MKKILLAMIFLSMAFTSRLFAQGSTTSAINGRVIDSKGEAIPGANVIAVQASTGTQYGNITDTNGFFRLSNMAPGGPYTVTISFVGYENFKQDNIFLALGQTLQINTSLKESTQQLQAVEITANANDVFDGNRTGQQTIVDRSTIQEIPSIGRSIQTFWQLNPMANIQPQSDNNTSLEASIAGMNNRFNALYIDGAVNNDVFGLAGNGSNGGQTGVAPISMDAIDQFQVSVAPFDVTVSGFAGGAVNAITRSGSNDVTGSAYYFDRNQNLAGETPTDVTGAKRSKLADFSSRLYGFRVGGPIVKNKAFFFINGEIQNQQTPQPFDANNYTGTSSVTDLQNLITTLKSAPFNYDPGGYTNNTNTLKSQKFLVRLDFNLGKVTKLTLRHSYVHAENVSAYVSTPQAINFYNNAIDFPSTTNSSSLELKSNFNRSSNNLILGSTLVRDNRNPFGQNFPSVTIYDGTGTIYLGSEQYSTANDLNQNILTFTDNFQLYRGKHTITFGTNDEYYYAYNLFIRQAYGAYTYGSLNDFMTKQLPISYARSYSLVDNIVGDGSAAAAKFHGYQLGAYAQDEYQVNDRFKATLGLRIDIPIFSMPTPVNSDFNSTTIPLLKAQGYDLQGAQTGKFIGSHIQLAPRFGFNYDIKGDKATQLRGGIGIFSSRMPLVWPGGAYNNTGTTVGGVFYSTSVTPNLLPSLWDYPKYNQQPPTTIVSGAPSGEIDLFGNNVKLPQVLKLDLAVDQKLPWGMVGTLEGLYTKYLNTLFYTNANLTTTGITYPYPGAFSKVPLYPGTTIAPQYSYIMVASNISKGYAYNIAASVTTNFSKGFNAYLSYCYGDSYSVNDLTSSQNNSQWRYRSTVTGQNLDKEDRRSIYSMGSKIIAQVSYRKEYLNHLASQISLLYTGQSGTPYSYLYSDGGKLTKVNTVSEELVYVPKTESDANLVDATVKDAQGVSHTITANQQWDALNDFISKDKYLSNHRGQFADRFSNRTPFRNIVDLRFLQDFYITTGSGKRNTLQFSLDMFNLTNFLNKNWGRMYYISSGEYLFESYAGTDPNTHAPEFTYTNGFDKSGNRISNYKPWTNSILDNNLRSSRWQMQVGVRYIFD